MKRLKQILFMLTLCGFYIVSRSQDIEDPHPGFQNHEGCGKCHASEFKFTDSVMTCNEYCSGCHRMERHHPVKILNTSKKAAKFRNLSGNRIACATCHDITRARHDNEPWRSSSLYDSIFSSQKSYKTFYLVMKNTNGELCKECH